MRVPLLVLAGVLVALALVPAARAAPASPAVSVPALVPHAPILIDGNAALTSANGVTGGSGTAADPYVIEGWAINASTANGIDVRNTTASLVVRNLEVSGPGAPWANAGIRFAGVRDAAVQNVTVSGVAAGVRIESSANVAVTGSLLSGNGIGVSAATVSNATLAANTVLSEGTTMAIGFDLTRFNDSAVRGNALALGTPGQGLHEIHLAASSGVTLTDNTIGTAAWIPSGGVGLWLDGDADVSLERNAFLARGISPTPFGGSAYHAFPLTLQVFASLSIPPNNTVNGLPILYCLGQPARAYDGVAAGEIILADCDGALVSNETFHQGQVGVLVALSRSVTILGNGFDQVTLGISTWASEVLVYHNNFNRSGVAQASSGFGASAVAYDDGYPRGGNYWSDNPGVDDCSGPSQNLCPDPDGFRDTWQELGPNVFDQYPLIRPANITERWPVALLQPDRIVADLLTPFRFDASTSYDLTDNGTPLEARWDFNGDGIWDTGWSSTLVVSHLYGEAGFYPVVVEVRDGGGLLSIASTVVLVEVFHGWNILVPVLGAVAATLAVNYGVHRFLAGRRRRRVTKTWTPPAEAKAPGGTPPEGPPKEPEPKEPEKP